MVLLGGCLGPLPSVAGELRKPGQGLRDRSDMGQVVSPSCENFHSFSGCLLHDALCLGLPVSSLHHCSQPPHNQGCLSKGAQTHSVRGSSQSTHVGLRACRAGCKRLDCIMLSFLSQQEEWNDGAGTVSVIWDSAGPEAWFSASTIIIYTASVKGNTNNVLEGN